jgi:hypothetical protein
MYDLNKLKKFVYLPLLFCILGLFLVYYSMHKNELPEKYTGLYCGNIMMSFSFVSSFLHSFIVILTGGNKITIQNCKLLLAKEYKKMIIAAWLPIFVFVFLSFFLPPIYLNIVTIFILFVFFTLFMNSVVFNLTLSFIMRSNHSSEKLYLTLEEFNLLTKLNWVPSVFFLLSGCGIIVYSTFNYETSFQVLLALFQVILPAFIITLIIMRLIIKHLYKSMNGYYFPDKIL